tara:strand:- start:313 stop:1287 length:975 start_codon:yes stop_codon:yes gene_type:complete
MGFHEVQFPTGYSYGTQGGPAFNTSIIVTDSGYEQRVARWDGARRRYNVREDVKSYSDIAEILEFYTARQGAAFGFRFKDFLDCTSSATGLDPSLGGADPDDEDQEIGVGDGSTQQFQLIKKYTSGPTTRTRTITKPVSGTVVVAIDGVNQASGWTVDTTTGVITFTSAPAIDEVITAGFEFDVPVRFGEEVDIDGLIAVIDGPGSGSIASFSLIEIIDGVQVDDEYAYGGGAETDITESFSLAIADGRVRKLNVTVASLIAILPDNTNLPAGGPYFILENTGSETLSIVDSDGTTVITTLAASAQGMLGITVDGGGSKSWGGL